MNIKKDSSKYEKIVNFIKISSKDRNIAKYPSPSSYVIEFPDDYKNIDTIQLIQATIPDQNNILAEPYILLKIAEIDTTIQSIDPDFTNTFMLLQLNTALTSPNGFIQVDQLYPASFKQFRTPKASISRFTIQLTKQDGTPFNFGTDNTSYPLNSLLQNTFIFQITTFEKQIANINS